GEGARGRARRSRLRRRWQRRAEAEGRADALRPRSSAARVGERVVDGDARRSERHGPVDGRTLVVDGVDVGLAVARIGLQPRGPDGRAPARRRLGAEGKVVPSLGDAALVGIGGALGSIGRWLVGVAAASLTASTFPYGTLTVNVTGAF